MEEIKILQAIMEKTDNERLYGTLKKANCRFAALKNKLRKEA